MPSSMTLQAPQWPSPQPILQPVSSRRSRRTLASVSFPSSTRVRSTPLMMSTFFIMRFSSFLWYNAIIFPKSAMALAIAPLNRKTYMVYSNHTQYCVTCDKGRISTWKTNCRRYAPAPLPWRCRRGHGADIPPHAADRLPGDGQRPAPVRRGRPRKPGRAGVFTPGQV